MTEPTGRIITAGDALSGGNVTGPVPVTFVAGWHGSGKSALLQRVARHIDPGSWGLVVPTGTPPIPAALRVETEEEVIERVPDCRRCALRHDLIWAIRRLTHRRRPPARVFAELSGWADPAIAAQTVMRDPRLAQQVRLDGLITVVDAPAFLVRACSGMSLWPTEEAADQVAIADVLVVDGAGKLTPAARVLVADLLRKANCRAEVLMDRGDGSELQRLLGIGALTPTAAGRVSHLAPQQPGRFPPAPSGGHLLEVAGELDGEGFDEWLADLDHHETYRLLRVAGIMAIAGEECRVACHRLETSIQVQSSGRWDDDVRVSRLYVSGRYLQPAHLQASLQACVRA